MNRRLSVFLLLVLFVHCGFSSDSTVSSIDSNDKEDDNTDQNQQIEHFKTSKTPEKEKEKEEEKEIETQTESIDFIVEQVVETKENSDIVSTTPVVDQPKKKEFLNEFFLNINLSPSFSSELKLKNDLGFLLLQTSEENQLFFINKQNGSVELNFQEAHFIPIYRENEEQKNLVAIFDEHDQYLWLINATDRVKTQVSFKPKRIFIVSSIEEFFLVETSNQIALFISSTSVLEWKTIDDSSSSMVLGWSKDVNSLVINQHLHHVKLLDLTNFKLIPILNDVSSIEIFSKYLIARKTTDDASLILSHLQNWPDQPFRSLPKRFQSRGNFYCALENINNEDLLLLFADETQLNENNETIPNTCRLLAYSKENHFHLENIHCTLSTPTEIQTESIRCSNQNAPIYQVNGLAKGVYLANVAPGPVTVVSLDGGINWNKTHYECDSKIDHCSSNISLIINSLTSSVQAPGIVVGKATNGVEEFIAVSTNAGHNWFLTKSNNASQVAISYPDALLVKILPSHQSSSTDNYEYSTDYGRTWQSGQFTMQNFSEVRSFIADENNSFYLITSNDQQQLSLVELDFNFLIANFCARHELKEWSLPNVCQNGLKIFYKRRTVGSRCLDKTSTSRSEPCLCTLTDFKCAQGYKRSKDGTCLPRSHYTQFQECVCQETNKLISKRRGYVKSSQCLDGIEDYLLDASVTRRESNQPTLFFFGINKHTNNSMIEIENNDFHAHGDEEQDEDEENQDDEEFTKNIVWQIDSTFNISTIAFDENSKQFFVALESDQTSILYRIQKDFRQQDKSEKKLTFDSNQEFFKSNDEQIQSIAIDWLSENLYVLVRNKKTNSDSIVLIDIRTRKRRFIVKNQQTQPATILVDPLKTNLYWITQNSPFQLNVANLQGQLKKKVQLSSISSKINYVAYDPVTHDVFLVTETKIYSLNTLNLQQEAPKLIYEHSSSIEKALFIYPTLFFTSIVQRENSTSIHLNTIDVVAKSFAKNVAFLKDFDQLSVFADVNPTMPKSAEPSSCENNPCSDICINLEHGKFRCICADDSTYQACTCPNTEKFSAGGCQAKNGQCAPGRVLCQNRINCAESASACEQDHTQYTEAFKTSSRCTLEKPDDGFDCYYTGTGIRHGNDTCIPYEWFCDGVKDCPMGNDEDHCYKLTTTTMSSIASGGRCLTEKRFNYAMCGNRCTKIINICRNVANAALCPEQFHLNCKKGENDEEYLCKCQDYRYQCIAMVEECDDDLQCRKVCDDSIRYANAQSDTIAGLKSSTFTYLVIGGLIGLVFIVVLVFICCRRDKRKQGSTKHTLVPNSEPKNEIPTSQHPN